MKVDTHAGVAMSVVIEASKTCPFSTRRDHGHVVVKWSTSNGSTLELGALRDLVGSYADVAITHEDFTFGLQSELSALVSDVTVESTWRAEDVVATCSC